MTISGTKWMLPTALSLMGLGLAAVPAVAATFSFNFSATYASKTINSPTTVPGVAELQFTGESANAPFDLTNANSLAYLVLNPAIGIGNFNTDPTVLGAPNLPTGFLTLFGNNSNNQLFGMASGATSLDVATRVNILSGELTLTGGQGIFKGATGILNLAAVETFNETFTMSQGEFTIDGVITTVIPEPSSTVGLIALGMVTGGVWLVRKQQQKSQL